MANRPLNGAEIRQLGADMLNGGIKVFFAIDNTGRAHLMSAQGVDAVRSLRWMADLVESGQAGHVDTGKDLP